MKPDLDAFKNTITGEYGEMCKLFESKITFDSRKWKTYGGHTINEWVTFSMFDSVDDTNTQDSWIVKYPDFDANPLVCEGELKVKISDWDEKETVLTNPHINDIFNFFANNHDGHHGFLEGVDWNEEEQILYLHSGS